MKIKILNPHAILPTIGYIGDAGLDLYTPYDVTLYENELKKIPLGFAIEIPIGYVGLILDRSSIAIKLQMKTMGGVIDCTYRGELFVNLKNFGNLHTFGSGDKIAQLVITKIMSPTEGMLNVVEELSYTSRGEKGFGSTDKFNEESALNRDLKNERNILEISAMMCTHANENPMNCLCDTDCYCKMHTCKLHLAVPGGTKSICGNFGRFTFDQREVNCVNCLEKIVK